MEVVRAFNNELSSLYEVRPPISKAKMTQITKCAIKGIKFYKHIVQSVEKFIQKCRPEYKIPGLYVVDSIVRQSRHQFGPDKDLFAPRFTKNISQTFQNLFKCAEEDRPRIVRVLNLWQKNSVFPSDVVQPLMDMANPNAGDWPYEQPIMASDSPARKGSSHLSSNEVIPKQKSAELSAWKGWPQGAEEPMEESHTYCEMSTRNLEKFTKATAANANSIEASQSPLAKSNPHKTAMVEDENVVKFNKKLLDFDYGDEEDDDDMKTDDSQLPSAPNPLALSISQNLLSNPELLRQLQQMQQTIQQSEALKSELAMQQQQQQMSIDKEVKERYSPDPPECLPPSDVNTIPYPEQHSSNVMPFQFDSMPPTYAAPQSQMSIMEVDTGYQHSGVPQDIIMQSSQVDEDDRVIYSMPGEPPLPPQDLDERAIVIPTLDDHIRKERSRSRSDSRSRTRSCRHRSRSRSPRRRKSSHSRRNRSRSREREREREREQERTKRGIPPVKKNHMTICSTTLWMGHVPKTLSEIDISSALADYGTVLSIDMIPPRGCAYVVMDRRKDAFRALQKLKNLKLQGSSIKVAWAPGKGVKGKEFKDFWEMKSGVSYIPFDKLPSDVESLELLEEGGFIDEESMPPDLQEMRQQQKDKVAQFHGNALDLDYEKAVMKDTMMTSAMMPPVSMGMTMVLPQMMQTQYGMPLPGMLPSQPMVVPLPVGVPPPNPLMMAQPPAQPLLAGTPLPVGAVPQMPHLTLPHQSIPSVSAAMNIMTTASSKMEMSKDHLASMPLGDATPTEEDGTSVSSPNVTNTVQAVSAAASSISLPTLSAQDTGNQFNAVVSHLGVSRPVLPVLPPVSSAGAPIPFPPPHVGFGFPPPPLRPGAPNQNLPGVLSLPNFPWIHKTSGPYGTYADADLRFTSPVSSAAMNIRHVASLMGQQGGLPVPSIVAQTTSDGQQSATQSTSQSSSSKNGLNKAFTPGQKDKENAELTNAEVFVNRPNISLSHMDIFARPDGVSPQSFEKAHEMRRLNQDETLDIMHAGFGDMDMSMIPRFTMPPDFHSVRGAIRVPWMHGPGGIPGPRYPPRGMHPNSSFPPRGGVPRPMHQPGEMEFFHHQGPPVPRNRMSGPHASQQTRWKNEGFQSQRGQDRFSNRRDFHEGSRFEEEEDKDRRHHSRNDYGRGREHWDDSAHRNDASKTQEKLPKSEKGASESSADSVNKKDDNQQDSAEKDKPCPPKQPKRREPDFSCDLFRLQSYGRGCSGFRMNPGKGKKQQNSKDRTADKQDSKGKTAKQDDKGQVTSQQNTKEQPAANQDSANSSLSSEKDVNSAENESRTKKEIDEKETPMTLDIEMKSSQVKEVPNNGQDNRSRRDRDRKRSRWGRTLSQEREFQQQKMNEIEMQLQNHQPPAQPAVENLGLNGGGATTEMSSDVSASTSVLKASDSVNVLHLGDLQTNAQNCNVQTDLKNSVFTNSGVVPSVDVPIELDVEVPSASARSIVTGSPLCDSFETTAVALASVTMAS